MTTPRGVRDPIPFEETYSQLDSSVLSAILGQSLNAVYVSEQNIGGLPAIGRGIDMVSSSVATMMAGAKMHSPAGDEVEAPQVVTRPNVLFGSFEFWQMVTQSLMYRGNFVGLQADFDNDGYPRQIIPIHVDMVNVDMSTGLPIYQIHDEEYSFDQVVHVRANAPVGTLWGRGIVEVYRATLEGQLYEQQFGANTFKNGAVPSAVITLDADRVDEATAEAVQTSWVDKHGAGERKPAVVPRTMNITPIGFSHKDAEWVSGRQLSIAECALMCGLDPSDLTASVGGTNMTYANLQSRQLARITDSYSKWMNLIEEKWSDLTPGMNTIQGNAEALLRTSTKERYELHQMALASGWRTKDEVRDIEGMGPLPKSETPPPAPAFTQDDQEETDDVPESN